MAQIINSNLASLNAQRNLNKSQGSLQTSLQRLSSGLRINSAKDDAAGLQISNKMTSQINGLNVAARNANDGISLAQTAEGALQEATNILQRMRDLSLQSANGTNSAEERAALNAESIALKNELNRISTTTRFGGKMLFDGNFTASAQIGARANETISFSVSSFRTTELGTRAERAATAATVTGSAAPTSMTIGTVSTPSALTASAAPASLDFDNTAAGTASTIVGSATPTSHTVTEPTNDILYISGGSFGFVTITLTPGTYADANALMTEINNQLSSSAANGLLEAYEVSGSVALRELPQTGLYSGNQISIDNNPWNAAAGIFGFASATGTGAVAGTPNTADITFDIAIGAATQTITLDQDYTGNTAGLVGAIQSQINGGALNGRVTVSADGSGVLSLTQTGTVTDGDQITLTGGDAATLFGATGSGSTASTAGSNNAFQIAVNGGAAQTITLADGTYTADALADEINRRIDANGTLKGEVRATVNEGKLEFKTTDTDVASSITFTAVASNTGLSNLGFTDAQTAAGAAAGPGTSSVESIDISTAAGAQSAIATIDAAISEIDATRGDLGAIQNRFTSTISNLKNIAENVSAARSRTLDADFAAETASLSKNQILQQAGISVLSQANSLPQQVLSLLQ